MEKDLKLAKYFAYFASLFLFGVLIAMATGHAQSANELQCDAAVQDTTMLAVSHLGQISAANDELKEQGADARVIVTSLAPGQTLDIIVADMGKKCAAWKSPNGGIKTNMLVFALAPKERKMGIFYGPGYNAALADHAARIKRDYMSPHFKGGDWAGGIIAGERQAASRIKASLDESNKPVTVSNETVNQPTDFHGLWVFFWIIGFLLAVACLLVIIYRFKKNKEDTNTAQQDAIASRSRAVDLLTDLNQEVNKYSDISVAPPNIKKAFSLIDVASRQLTTLAASISGDPTTEGMGKSFYNSLKDSYERLEQKLQLAKTYIDTTDTVDDSKPAKPKDTRKANHSVYSGAQEGQRSATETPTPPPAPSAPAPIHETVVVKDSGNDMLTGMLIGEAIGGSRREYAGEPRPESTPEPEPERHASHHESDDDSSSSSSGGWGGSSSDSSSSSSSSDWGGSSSDSSSSSSDSGSFGGGSSDF